MGKRAKTPSYVAEFEVETTSKDRSVLLSRLEAARQLYNAVLGESLRRLARMREDAAFAEAKAMPSKIDEKANPAKHAAFKALREEYGFRDYDLHKLSSLSCNCWLRGHLDVQTEQKIATRAFKAAERYSFGKSGRPRFKRYGELGSVEGKANAAGIRYRSGSILWNGEFAKLELPLIVKVNDQVQAYALKEADQGKVKYARLLTRSIRGEERVYAQLVLEGKPWIKVDKQGEVKHSIGAGVVGMDLGPSHVAFVVEGKASSTEFCRGLDRKAKALRRYQRRMDRQRRANNPENYNSNGTAKKGRLPWKSSARQRRTQHQVKEHHRTLAAQRKSLQGELAHQVLSSGNQVITEKVSKSAWARRYGRSVGHKAPGFFEARVATLALASGGSFEPVSTYSTFLSSRCLCGERKKKTLRERKHFCGCEFVPEGTNVDRDEFSAFLAIFSQGSLLGIERARSAWKLWGADCLLRPVPSHEIANGEALLSLRVRDARQSGSTGNESGHRREVASFGGRRAPEVEKPSKDSYWREGRKTFASGNPLALAMGGSQVGKRFIRDLAVPALRHWRPWFW